MSRSSASPAPVFAALGDETRLALLGRLSASGPLSIARLAAGSDVTRQAVTRHLDVLVEARLVRDHRSGRERIFELNPGGFLSAREYLVRVSERWDEAIARLRDLVEK